MSRPLLPPAHAGVIFIYYLLWQQREWRGVGESVLSVLKCLTIWMKFSMWRTRGRPCVFFSFFFLYYLFPRRWWKDGEGRRDVQRERWSWQKERRPPNPPVYWSGLRPVCCGDRWGSEGGREGGRSGDLQHVTPLGPPGGRKKNKKTPEHQSDETRRLPKWQERHLRRGSLSNMETPGLSAPTPPPPPPPPEQVINFVKWERAVSQAIDGID